MKCAPTLLIGDWLIIGISVVLVGALFHTLWHNEPASQLKIKRDNQIIGVYDLNPINLNPTRDIQVQGAQGIAIIRIEHGKVRFKQSPCTNQYCVHQGWLSHAGEAAICLPNHITLQLTGATSPYDSLNY